MSGLIRISYGIVTPESAEDGAYAETGWEDEEGAKHSVQSAIALLRCHCVEPSNSPSFCPGTWYTEYNAHEDFRTGAVTSRAYHLDGFSEVEERAIYEGVRRGWP